MKGAMPWRSCSGPSSRIDFLHFDSDGRVNEMAVYVRPMSGVTALAEAMKRKLEEVGAA